MVVVKFEPRIMFRRLSDNHIEPESFVGALNKFGELTNCLCYYKDEGNLTWITAMFEEDSEAVEFKLKWL